MAGFTFARGLRYPLGSAAEWRHTQVGAAMCEQSGQRERTSPLLDSPNDGGEVRMISALLGNNSQLVEAEVRLLAN